MLEKKYKSCLLLPPSILTTTVCCYHPAYLLPLSVATTQHTYHHCLLLPPSTLTTTVCCYHPAYVTTTVFCYHPAYVVTTTVCCYHPAYITTTVCCYHPAYVTTTVCCYHPELYQFRTSSNPHTATVVYWNKLTYSCMGKSLCSMYNSMDSAVTIPSTLFGQAGITLILLLVTLGSSSYCTSVLSFQLSEPEKAHCWGTKTTRVSFLLVTFGSNIMAESMEPRQSVTCTSTCPGASLITKLSAHFLLYNSWNQWTCKHNENVVLSF